MESFSEGANRMRLVDPKTLSLGVFRLFGAQNALLTAGDRSELNTMTIGWCQLGRIWNEPACTVYVRPERYTYEFTEGHDYFTVSILPADRREVMQLCGTKSGREVDKVAECALSVAYGAGDAPYFEEAELVLVCKKLYAQDMGAAHVVDGGPVDRFYGPKDGWHRMYIGQILEAYTRE